MKSKDRSLMASECVHGSPKRCSAIAALRSGQRLAPETVRIPFHIEQREST